MDDDFEMPMASQKGPSLGEAAPAPVASRDGSAAGFKACRFVGMTRSTKVIGLVLVVGFGFLKLYFYPTAEELAPLRTASHSLQRPKSSRQTSRN